jgi:hypothetical protein
MMSSITPYGYQEGPRDDLGRRTHVENVDEQMQIARMVDWAAAGMQPAKIARRLNEEGVPCRGSHKYEGRWGTPMVKRCLKRAGMDV